MSEKHRGELSALPKIKQTNKQRKKRIKERKKEKKSSLVRTFGLWLISACFPSKSSRVSACCSLHCSSARSSWGYWFEWGELAGLMILSLRLPASFCFLGLHPIGLNVIKIAENITNNKHSSTFQRLISCLPASTDEGETLAPWSQC